MDSRAAHLPLLVALVCFVPFLRGLGLGHAFFFRDLASYFFPLRLFALRGLGAGELRYWNPLTHEGEPLALLPIGYLPDLLQALHPSEAWLSWLLALHLPLAALGAFALGRHLGLERSAAAVCGIVYGLAGFALSSLNLYVYVQALAWAPFLIRGLGRAATGRGREVAVAALLLATALSTTGLEIVAQAVLIGLVLAWPRDKGALLRTGLALVLGTSLAAAVILPVSFLVADSARGQGFPTEVVLAHSVHPITLVQTLVAGLFADPARFTDTFWGQNYFPRGFPYFLSLYVGPLALGLALLGSFVPSRLPRLLLALLVLGALVSLGRYAGLSPLVDALAPLRRFRFPSKAFFTVHLAVAVLSAFGLDALVRGADPRTWRRASLLLLGLGVVTALLPWALLEAAGPRLFLLAGFFPPEMAFAAREAAASAIARDAALGGLAASCAGLLALAVDRGRFPGRRAAAIIAALLAADLLRAGAGLNPMVAADFFRPSPAVVEVALSVRAERGRLFSLDPSLSPAYYAARARRGDHEAWSFAVLQETLVPNFNLGPGVPTALSLDQTMLVPERRILRPTEGAPASVPRVLPRLRAAGVTHVLSVEPLSLPELEVLDLPDSPRVAPLRTWLYRLRDPRPREEVSEGGRIVSADDGAEKYVVETLQGVPASLLVRAAWSRGWTARVDGAFASVDESEEGHRLVFLRPGRHEVAFVYRPPGLATGLALTLLSALVTFALLRFSPSARDSG